MPRFSEFHTSLHRPRLIMGVEKGSFALLVLYTCFCFAAQFYAGMLLTFVGFFVARWMSKKDDAFISILGRYLREEHAYDATQRPRDHKKRPKGWGRGVNY